ncbi:MAG TPA: alpha-L-arabinofuranosidase, partial [Chitinophagaceae bacterium]|nr:alpha-L-arabinofuranosidase [Chitinophagaceae bacterium]
KSVEIKFTNFKKGAKFYWYTLTGSTDNGEFSRKTLVNGVGPAYAAGGPDNYKNLSPSSSSASNGVRVIVPGRACVFVVVAKQ